MRTALEKELQAQKQRYEIQMGGWQHELKGVQHKYSQLQTKMDSAEQQCESLLQEASQYKEKAQKLSDSETELKNQVIQLEEELKQRQEFEESIGRSDLSCTPTSTLSDISFCEVIVSQIKTGLEDLHVYLHTHSSPSRKVPHETLKVERAGQTTLCRAEDLELDEARKQLEEHKSESMVLKNTPFEKLNQALLSLQERLCGSVENSTLKLDTLGSTITRLNHTLQGRGSVSPLAMPNFSQPDSSCHEELVKQVKSELEELNTYLVQSSPSRNQQEVSLVQSLLSTVSVLEGKIRQSKTEKLQPLENLQLNGEEKCSLTIHLSAVFENVEQILVALQEKLNDSMNNFSSRLDTLDSAITQLSQTLKADGFSQEVSISPLACLTLQSGQCGELVSQVKSGLEELSVCLVQTPSDTHSEEVSLVQGLISTTATLEEEMKQSQSDREQKIALLMKEKFEIQEQSEKHRFDLMAVLSSKLQQVSLHLQQKSDALINTFISKIDAVNSAVNHLCKSLQSGKQICPAFPVSLTIPSPVSHRSELSKVKTILEQLEVCLAENPSSNKNEVQHMLSTLQKAIQHSYEADPHATKDIEIQQLKAKLEKQKFDVVSLQNSMLARVDQALTQIQQRSEALMENNTLRLDTANRALTHLKQILIAQKEHHNSAMESLTSELNQSKFVQDKYQQEVNQLRSTSGQRWEDFKQREDTKTSEASNQLLQISVTSSDVEFQPKKQQSEYSTVEEDMETKGEEMEKIVALKGKAKEIIENKILQKEEHMKRMEQQIEEYQHEISELQNKLKNVVNEPIEAIVRHIELSPMDSVSNALLISMHKDADAERSEKEMQYKRNVEKVHMMMQMFSLLYAKFTYFYILKYISLSLP